MSDLLAQSARALLPGLYVPGFSPTKIIHLQPYIFPLTVFVWLFFFEQTIGLCLVKGK